MLDWSLIPGKLGQGGYYGYGYMNVKGKWVIPSIRQRFKHFDSNGKIVETNYVNSESYLFTPQGWALVRDSYDECSSLY